jgi:hypothetical protein
MLSLVVACDLRANVLRQDKNASRRPKKNNYCSLDIHIYGSVILCMNPCILCRYSGGSNTLVNEVNQYISQNISVLDLEEIAQQAAEMLCTVVEQQCTSECIKRHINEHTQEPRIIVSLLLRDIRSVVDEVRHCSRTVDEEGKVCIDKTNMLLYLKTVEVAANLAMRLN